MDKLTKVINKFLDSYIGDEIDVKYFPSKEFCQIYSKKKVLILSFNIRWDGSIIIFRGLMLCNMICRFFSVSDDEAMRYVRAWFANKHNMNKVSDLKKFIPTPVNS